MRIFFTISFIVFVICSCSNEQIQRDKTLLTPLEFSDKIKETNFPVIVDVRTPDEYSQGHIQQAKNIDWNEENFEKQISLIDTIQPVFIYCLSGGRSSSAASKMLSMGFSKVYELEGGILKWRNAGLPETTDIANKSMGMGRAEFDSLIISNKLVLVDFYAPWCAPCKKMKPELDELVEQMKDKLIILRINADEHQFLFKQLNLETLPTVLLYKNKNLIWTSTGYVSKEEISKQLKWKVR